MQVARHKTDIPIDDRFIMRKYNERNHSDRAQININSNKNNTMASVWFPDHNILIPLFYGNKCRCQLLATKES